ncbi:hypothetical protein SAMN04487843_105140 [Methylobacterium sp. ap11]|nr:hypothetical protein SAMN04487843_105140 [Methylobacterium sp. ap11]
MARALRERDVAARLRSACREVGGQASWAALAGVSRSYVTEVLAGRCAPGEAILLALGLERDVRYVARRPREIALYDEHGVTLLTAEML